MANKKLKLLYLARYLREQTDEQHPKTMQDMIAYLAGCGISAEDLPKIKTKFFKANQTRRGSGIGLAVASEIIQMHNGSIDIESTLNVGTTVLIRLPIQPQERNSENEQEQG